MIKDMSGRGILKGDFIVFYLTKIFTFQYQNVNYIPISKDELQFHIKYQMNYIPISNENCVWQHFDQRKLHLAAF